MALALFDLDNTLLAGDSDYLWGNYLCDLGVVDKEFYEQENQRFYDQYRHGELDIHEFLAFSLKPLADNSMDDLLAWREQFIETRIRPIASNRSYDLIQKHRDAGDTLLIITATNSFVTAPIAELFGIPTLIATEPEQENGRFTGKVSGTPSYRDGKVTRLHRWLQQNNQNLDDSWFYSDSHNDIPLLEEVSNPVAVNPDEQLQGYALKHNWPILNLHA